MKVFLVEDEEFIRDLFKRQLDLSGFATDAFSNGQDGLSAISKNAYDLVLLDIMLPDINGLQILQNIRQNPATKGVAVVLLTNLGQDAVIKQGFELGADGYLVKAAYTPDQIVQEVKNIMQKRQAQKPPAAATTPPPPPGQPADPTMTSAPAAAPPAPEAPAPTPLNSEPQMPAFPGQAPAAVPDPMINSASPAMPAAPETPAIPDALAPAAAPAAPTGLSASDITSAASSTEETPPPTPTTETASNS